MAFGDNYNDVSMLDIAGTPYIMDATAALLRKKHPNHTRRPGDVADPWYTGDFEATWQDVLEGCTALLEELR